MKTEPSQNSKGMASNGDVLAERIAEIEASLRRESWLPISLRGFLATELPQLRKAVLGDGKRWQRSIAKRLLVLAMATWVYGPSPLNSETISRLQALDLEFNGSVSMESKKKD